MKKSNLYYCIKGVQATLEQAKGIDIQATKHNKIGTIVDGDKELSIHYIPDMCKLGAICAALYYSPLSKSYIMVDGNYMTLSPEDQKAVLAHEMGHYALKHLKVHTTPKAMYQRYVFLGKLTCASDGERDVLIASTLNTRDYTQELEADAYAVDMCGKDVVLSMLERLYLMAPGSDVQERYAHITGGKKLRHPFAYMFSECNNVISLDDLE